MNPLGHFILVGISLLLVSILHIRLRAYPWVQYLLTALYAMLYAYLTEGSPAALCIYGLLMVTVMIANSQYRWHGLFKFVALLFGLAIVLRWTPGFDSIGPVASELLSPLSGEWTIYGGINKALVGLILLPLVRYPDLNIQAFKEHYAFLLFAPVLIACAAYLGGLPFDFKFSVFTLLFLFSNLIFVVIAEEIFFRGLIQQYLCEILKGRFRIAIGILIASALFGLAHLRGGEELVVFATMAGMAYGVAYWKLRSIWASIYLHLAVNMLHMVFFKFPF